MTQPTIHGLGNGRFAITGSLNFETVGSALEAGADAFQQESDLVLDLKGVERADSAGLALLVEWARMARQHDQQIRFANVPSELLNLAAVSGVDHVLSLAGK